MSNSHNKLIQTEFTKQATAYATNPTIIDPDWAQRLVQAVNPSPQDRILDIATGPGYVAMAFAPHVQEVVGVDLTDAPLAIAEKTRQERSLENVRFEQADASQLPFADGHFDGAACRLAFHHFADAKPILAEMVRACRVGGTIAVEDLIASEHPSRADYYNHWERLRDPSHTTALSLTQLVNMFTELGVDITHIQMEHRTQPVEQWMKNSQTPSAVAEEIRTLIQTDQADNLSGIHIFHNEADELCFHHRMLTVVGRKLG